jgi:hypothetical protein
MHRCRASASVLVVEIDTFVIRRGVEADASAVADVWLRSFTAALPSVHRAHTDEQVRAWFRTRSCRLMRSGWRPSKTRSSG